MEALDILKAEHSTLLNEACAMDKQLTFLESSGPRRGVRILKEIVLTSRRMREDLDQHTAKEEKEFFPILESKLGNDRELVKLMKREHQQLLGLLDSLTVELSAMIKNHDTKRTWNLVSRLQDLKAGLSNHVSKEERLLFWIADLRLSRLDRRKIASSLQAASSAAGPLKA
jgi:hemerythrin-like domain-containing protein